MNESSKPRIGISSCLLGNEVRLNGGHSRYRYATDILGKYVEWVPVCPEVESGMTIPREAVRLVEEDQGILLLGTKSGNDYTEQLLKTSSARIKALASLELDGFILKNQSPSCGLERIKIYAGLSGQPIRKDGTGIFARALKEHLPILPVIEEGWLNDQKLRESFLCRIFTLQRMRSTVFKDRSPKALQKFQAEHKFLYMSHNPGEAKLLGKICAASAPEGFDETLNSYTNQAMRTLETKSSPGKHHNVLQHILGFFKNVLDQEDRHEVLHHLKNYKVGMCTLAVPLSILAHHLRKTSASEWLASQVYFQPFPLELLSR